MSNERLSKFLSRHNIQILDTNKQWYRKDALGSFFCHPDSYDIVTTSINTAEPLYTVTIPEGDLQKLQQLEDYVHDNQANSTTIRLFDTLVAQKNEEYRLRKKYPAVQKAYEKYSLMLNLCVNNNKGEN
jgi:hypothetical protein